MGTWLKRIFKLLLVILLLVILVVVGAYFAIQKESVQNWLTQKVTNKLSKKLQTKVEVKNIKIDFMNHLNLNGAYIADKQNDTLLYAGELQFKITDWFFLKKDVPEISYIKLSDAVVNLKRETDTTLWNYDFIAAAFANNNTVRDTTIKTQKNNEAIKFILKKVALNNVRFNSTDKWQGQDIFAKLGVLDLKINTLDLDKKNIDINNLLLGKVNFTYNEYAGGKPKKPKPPRDTTAFNPGWLLALHNLDIQELDFIYNANSKGYVKSKVFNENHIYDSKL